MKFYCPIIDVDAAIQEYNIFEVSLFLRSVDTINTASLLRQILDKPLLNEQGGFLSEAYEFAESKQEAIKLLSDNTIH